MELKKEEIISIRGKIMAMEKSIVKNEELVSMYNRFVNDDINQIGILNSKLINNYLLVNDIRDEYNDVVDITDIFILDWYCKMSPIEKCIICYSGDVGGCLCCGNPENRE